jgi:hypothetical protein
MTEIRLAVVRTMRCSRVTSDGDFVEVGNARTPAHDQ